ncbi:hypothetical protein HOV23_gp020 [Pseudomonas phage Lana]|uniref:Uncharacterized protein n=1 Tax=Pseudomonas phage Lana TaxID=2530172 RepID=A0A481W6G5_9CAUD|nr:hypothetical protein HOV23_gp020 [Pseudomonas phage Lana]QBJ04553.1 hypothetical protein [Pseudomonas phage Lana]
MHFFVTDDQDVVIQVGSSQETLLEVNAVPGTIHFGDAPHGTFKYINGEFVHYERELAYDAARQKEYPQVTAQLDALWHAMDRGELPKVAGFYDEIKEVKDKYVKPE